MSIFKRLFKKNNEIKEISETQPVAAEDTKNLQSAGLEKAEEFQKDAVLNKDNTLSMDKVLIEDEPREDAAVQQSANWGEAMSISEIEAVQQIEIGQDLETVKEDDTVQSETGKKESFIKKLFSGLSKTRDHILKGVDEVLGAFKQIDEDLYEELEEVLIMADFGVETTLDIMSQLKQAVKQQKISEPAKLKETLQQIITDLLVKDSGEVLKAHNAPTVILVIGVNGAGKTTSIGKLAHLFKQNHQKVLLAAADTFRAAAIEQLQIWANRAGVELIKHEEGSDAAAVVYDAISAAKSRRSDVLICDTAGRLQNKTNLMKELEKISRIIEREYPEAHKEILIVLDATTGQNALQQVRLFKEVANISGIILTKLDGTAKGGAIVAIHSLLKVPVKYIGVGETIEDLQPFDPRAFAAALFKDK